ncbi:MAG: aminotransferase class V-fold PLP-dependent enzyme, partial [Bdellovibrionaceae bacterium]|nr:aminotransferase class V-fold PLP-dependent enzyme [Pseudobdellovibrionaceae bacterium]
WGQAVDPEQIRTHLKQKPYRAVLTQACETSTGTLHPIAEIGKIVAEYPECLFLVDGITAVGAVPLPMDAWKIDGLVAGSQKAFMLPTGLSLVSLSQKAWKRAQVSRLPRYYFDLRREKSALEKGGTHFSSNVPLVRALDWVLKDMEARGGLEALHAEIRGRAEFARKFAQVSGLGLYSSSPSDSLTVFKLPGAIDGEKLRDWIERERNITLIGGQDKAKGKILRMGHMGYITKEDMLRAFAAIGDGLHALLPQQYPADLGDRWQSEMERCR